VNLGPLLRENNTDSESCRQLTRILSFRRKEVIRDWRKLHNDTLHNMYELRNVIRMNKSMKVRLAGHVAQTGDSIFKART
jgi:hypothetical protein